MGQERQGRSANSLTREADVVAGQLSWVLGKGEDGVTHERVAAGLHWGGVGLLGVRPWAPGVEQAVK